MVGTVSAGYTGTERFWPAGDAIGQRIMKADSSDDERMATIVGVVESVRHDALESKGRMATYKPRLSAYRTYLVVSTVGDLEAWQIRLRMR